MNSLKRHYIVFYYVASVRLVMLRHIKLYYALLEHDIYDIVKQMQYCTVLYRIVLYCMHIYVNTVKTHQY